MAFEQRPTQSQQRPQGLSVESMLQAAGRVNIHFDKNLDLNREYTMIPSKFRCLQYKIC